VKSLIIDIETSPNLAHVWSLWNNNVSLAQLQESSYMMCFAAKWYGEKGTFFARRYGDDNSEMLGLASALLDQADALITYNGNKFDIPILNQELLLGGFPPPAPSKSIDLCAAVKKTFRFPSNKLEYVSRALGLEGKTSHTGHQLWVDCLAEKREAWKLMKKYNIQDVLLLEPLYEKLLPWLPTHPNMQLHVDDALCHRCGGERIQMRGYVTLLTGKYQRFQCQECGAWGRLTKREASAQIVGVK
jgi:hypothetical protein